MDVEFSVTRGSRLPFSWMVGFGAS